MSGCVVSLDERRHDKAQSKLDVYSREQLIASEIADHLEVFTDFPEEILDHMTAEEHFQMLSDWIGMLLKRKDGDFVEGAFECCQDIAKRHLAYAENKAEEHAEDVGL